MVISRVSLLCHCSNFILPSFSASKFSPSTLLPRRFIVSASISSNEALVASISPHEASASSVESANPKRSFRWKPMCLYYTQGKCTLMQDSTHLERFNHNFSLEHTVNAAEYKNKHSKHLDFFLVLDLEGKAEILEFPVLMMDAGTLEIVDFFHRFVRPSQMSQKRINEYIKGKYGKLAGYSI